MYLYIPLVLIALYYAGYYYFTRTFNYWKKRKVVGPEPSAIVGNIKDQFFRTKNVCLVYEDLYKMFPKEKVVGIYRMTTPSILIRDLDVLKQIMIKDFDVFHERGFDLSKKGLGENLFHADGESWSALRNRFTPIFTSGKLKNMYHLLEGRADLLLQFLDKNSMANPEHEIYSLVQRYTISTILTCAFGIDIDTYQQEDIGPFKELKALDALAFTPNYAFDIEIMYPGLLRALNLSAFPIAIAKFFNSLVRDIVSQRGGKPTNRGDFMDLILQLKEMGQISGSRQGAEHTKLEITESIMAAQAFVFYLAGYETSATTMAYMLYQLAMNPEVQDKLIEEIDTVTKAHDGKITYESLKEMKYLDKTMSETLRMYPIVDPIQRRAVRNYKIPDTDVVIEKGIIALVSARAIHHDPQYYPDPEKFDPNRFNHDVVAERHPCAYIPFGIGPRNCIGMRFAQLQSRLCVSKILSKFRVEPCKNTKNSLGFNPNRLIAGSEEKIILNIVPRK